MILSDDVCIVLEKKCQFLHSWIIESHLFSRRKTSPDVSMIFEFVTRNCKISRSYQTRVKWARSYLQNGFHFFAIKNCIISKVNGACMTSVIEITFYFCTWSELQNQILSKIAWKHFLKWHQIVLERSKSII